MMGMMPMMRPPGMMPGMMPAAVAMPPFCPPSSQVTTSLQFIFISTAEALRCPVMIDTG